MLVTKQAIQTTGAHKMTYGITVKLKNLIKDFKKTSNPVGEKINETITNIFHDDKLNGIAKDTDFVQRSSSRLKGKEFVQAMAMASIEPESTPLSGINDNLRSLSSKANMTVSALRQRINSQEAYKFLQQVYLHTIGSHLKPLSDDLNAIKQNFDKGALEHFTKVLLHDSSSCKLNEHLEKDFKGSGGAASKSLVKADLIYDIKANSAEEIILTDVREPDQGLSKRVIKHMAKGVLTIQDLGYFDIDTFQKIKDIGGFFLSRLPGLTHVYLNEDDKEPIELAKKLLKMLMNNEPLDMEAYITKKKIKVRLIAYPVPDDVFNKRLREYYQKNKKKTPTEEWIARQRFTILITNVPSEIWSCSVIGTVYKIRWQVELIFKVWKSQISIHYLKGTKPERIKCLLYSRLLVATLIFTVFNGISHIVSSVGCELSLHKFVDWLKRTGRFARIVLKGFTTELWRELIKGLDLLCKDWQRARKTTRQMIEDEIPFLDIFKKPREYNA